ncbi:MAG: hypothetical protein ACI9FN_000210 [Saprospiraceae bacterium]|jgi:hypothetical protein
MDPQRKIPDNLSNNKDVLHSLLFQSKKCRMVSKMRERIESILLSMVFLLFCANTIDAQKFGWGAGLRHDLYTHYSNPPDDIASRRAGSAIINIGVGPKLWIGDGDFSFSPEAYFMWSPFALSSKDYKGMGAFSIPIMAKFEFLGNSNFNNDGKFGFSIGGGIQYSKTELWGLKEEFKEQGVNRDFFKTYIVEGDFGFGISGFDIHLFLRYGWNKNIDARTWNVGIGYDFNIPCLKEATNSEF